MEGLEGRGALWTVAAPLIALKVWATALLLLYAPTRDAIAMIVATGWPWAVVFLCLVAAPAFAWWRLVRVRARREQLRRSEWMLDESDTASTLDPDQATQWPLWDTVSRFEGGS